MFRKLCEGNKKLVSYLANLWEASNVLEDQKRQKYYLFFRKESRGNWWNYRPVSLTSVPSNIVEYVTQLIQKHLEESKISNSRTWICQEQRVSNHFNFLP